MDNSDKKTRSDTSIRTQSGLLKSCGFDPIPDDGIVKFYKRDRPSFGFLSNFYVAPIAVDGEEWPHTEAYYQSRKSDNPAYHIRIRENEKPSWSKYVGDSRIGHPDLARKSWFRRRPEDLRPDWDAIKLDVMRTALRAKFTQHCYLRLALLATDQAKLVEDSESDNFWGMGQDEAGYNWLGRLLVELRFEMENERIHTA